MFPEGSGSQDRNLEQKGSLYTCCSFAPENADFAACASKRTLIFFPHRGPPQRSGSGPPGQPDTWQLPRPIIINPQGRPGEKPFNILHKPSDCWAHGNIPKIFFCAIETPAWKIPAASTSFSQAATPACFAARSCVTKGISPANRTCRRAAESRLPELRVITPRQYVFLLCVISSSVLRA